MYDKTKVSYTSKSHISTSQCHSLVEMKLSVLTGLQEEKVKSSLGHFEFSYLPFIYFLNTTGIVFYFVFLSNTYGWWLKSSQKTGGGSLSVTVVI